MASTINAQTTGFAGVVTTADASGVLNIQTGGVTAMSISAAQVVTFTNPVTSTTLSNPTITNYTETTYTATGSTTISLANGTVQKITTSGSTTITLPASATGKSFTVIVSYAAADTLTWAGGTTLKWASSTTPTPTSATGKLDIFNFYQDGTNTYGSVYGQNY
jgi:hypothetical protein